MRVKNQEFLWVFSLLLLDLINAKSYFKGMSKKSSSCEIEGSIFVFLSSLFRRHNVDSVLVGGYALILNNVQRMTFDIDFIITAEDYLKIKPDIINAGYTVFHQQEAFVQLRSKKQGLRDIDFLISDRNTIKKLLEHGKEATIAGEKFIVPSPEHLISMKLHSIAGNKKRELKDFPDVVQLIKANNIDPEKKDLKDIFEKYDMMDLYKKVCDLSGMRSEKRKRK